MQESIAGLSGLFISAFISSTVAPGGSEVVLALLVNQRHYPIGQLLIVATLGNTLGAMTTWGLGALAATKVSVAGLLPANQQKALVIIRKAGVWILLFSWLPVLGDALCFAGGWLRLSFWPACLMIMLGKLGRYAAIAWVFN
ncbi:MAG: DedA family protein [Methylovulum sp.]|uniref:YqaA family protein n=1 Tax=Methylovulum sp. TaxID=1916980 RepID=UPI0026298375|nr:YqaA family protein [Methylovulum sp.]MDD2723177.1 DedA family protein [Methylovulum sp.]MDD5124643.1 DedA family protein [Methylovulum sp.]